MNKLFLLYVVAIFGIIISSQLVVGADPDSYTYKRMINVSTLSDNTPPEYDLRVNVTNTTFNGNIQSDCDDVAFFDDSETTQLEHYVEYCGYTSSDSEFWVNMPDNVTTTNTTIWLYYNNGTVTTESNTSIFKAWDNFNDNNLSSDWNDTSFGSSNVDEQSGHLEFQSDNDKNPTVKWVHNLTNFCIFYDADSLNTGSDTYYSSMVRWDGEMRGSASQGDTGRDFVRMHISEFTDALNMVKLTNGGIGGSSTWNTTGLTINANEWYEFKVCVNQSDLSNTIYQEGVKLGDLTYSSTDFNGNEYIGFEQRELGTGITLFVDNFKVTEYFEGSYEYDFGAEENVTVEADTDILLTLYYPENVTYESLPIDINITLNKTVNSCSYTLNDTLNGSLTSINSTYYSHEISELLENTYLLNVSCSDATDEVYTEIAFTYDVPENVSDGDISNVTYEFTVVSDGSELPSYSVCADSNTLMVVSTTQYCAGQSGNYTPTCFYNNVTRYELCSNGCYDNMTMLGSGCAETDFMLYVYGIIIFIASIILIRFIVKARVR